MPAVTTSPARFIPLAASTRPGYTQFARTPQPKLPDSKSPTRMSRSNADFLAA
jgi:hypothetical protein